MGAAQNPLLCHPPRSCPRSGRGVTWEEREQLSPASEWVRVRPGTRGVGCWQLCLPKQAGIPRGAAAQAPSHINFLQRFAKQRHENPPQLLAGAPQGTGQRSLRPAAALHPWAEHPPRRKGSSEAKPKRRSILGAHQCFLSQRPLCTKGRVESPLN